ncbi:TetR/AcrR family transcriptional regulator [Micromonospora sp. KC213]|uniref:TetR/AcrR family transcriptional regulator n=1 Tax=Micromonospora sp. KC213 TaxID=2530378 RepID=UPI00105110C6|nr:TetR/AcrR family transcriptional regulator [Micromonospora sp. KC213]TDC38323.1 TetR/AcrR family transcriptional regulator [Micromonospora sp. KC213]
MAGQAETLRRVPLNRDRVLRAAVTLADDIGIESLSMRKLAQELGVVPMALYKHVTNKDELLDGMIDVVVAEIDPPEDGTDWKAAIRQRILAARRTMLRHPWASRAIETRQVPTPAVLAYLDAMVGTFRTGGFSVDLTHHVMHAMGSRILGFTQELFTPQATPADPAVVARAMAPTYPHLAEIAMAAAHEDASVVGSGCDDQFEFEFALDLLLDGFERLHEQHWTSAPRAPGHHAG